MVTGAALSAAIVASAGAWWFAYVMKGMKSADRSVRWGVYALVWLAYFIVTMILIDKTGA